MAKKHFSIPDKALDWLTDEGKKLGLSPGRYLSYLLTKLMDEQEREVKG